MRINENYLKMSAIASCAFLMSMAVTPDASAREKPCKHLHGRIIETLMHPAGAPNDPLGRVLGKVSGSLKGSETAILLTPPTPNPETGALESLVSVTFMTGPGDTLATEGLAVLSPIPGTLHVSDTVTVDILPEESTGKFHGTTGTIILEGVGFDFFPAPSPGNTIFVFKYRGEICGLEGRKHRHHKGRKYRHHSAKN